MVGGHTDGMLFFPQITATWGKTFWMNRLLFLSVFLLSLERVKKSFSRSERLEEKKDAFGVEDT